MVRVTVGAHSTDNASTYSYAADAMPVDPTDTTAGVGQVSVTAPVWPGSRRVGGQKLTIEASNLPAGGVSGELSDPMDDSQDVTLTSFSVLGRLNTVKRVGPYSGTVAGLIGLFFSTVGITDYTIDSSLSAPVAMIGFQDNLWVKLRELAAVYQVDVTANATHVDVAPRSWSTTDLLNIGFVSQRSWSQHSQLAQSIEVICYNTVQAANRVCYPAGSYDATLGGSTADGWSAGAQIIQVGYRSSTVVVAQVNASLTSVIQPVCAAWVGQDDNTGASYTVLGIDPATNNPVKIDPATWTSHGGSVTTAINEDGQSITITVSSGSNDSTYAPYSIAMTDGQSTWSTLRIAGTGVFFAKSKYIFPTGVPATLATTDVGVTVDSQFVASVEQTYDVAAAVLPLYAAPFKTATYHLDDLHGPNTPAYSAIAGTRVRDGDAMFRIQSTVISETGIDLSAAQQSTIADHNHVWAGKTIADWNAFWADGVNTWQTFSGEPLAHP